MAQKKFIVTLDPTEFIKGTKSLEESFDRLQKKVQGAITIPESTHSISEVRGEVDGLSNSFKRASELAAGIFAVNGIQDFVSRLYSVRGEFQQLEISFRTMLGSGEQANELINQLAQTAASTPFDLQGIASSAKNMLAYGFAADQVNDTIVRLGNVAAGLSQPLGDIVYLYGTLKASGRVTNIDIRQFANRGIPIYEELAKVLGKSVSEINNLVSAGKVGFLDIEQAFQNMTNKGGKFYNLMEEQSKSLTGQISNLQDNIDMMFNELGKSSEGMLSSGIKAVSYLVENYEKVGKVIAGLIATYGVYRAAVITNIALTQGWAAATKADAIAKGIQTIATNATTFATKRLTAALLANPYGAIAVALTAVISAMWAFSDSTSAAEKAQKDFNEEKKRAEEEEQKHKEAVESLINVARDEASATADRQSALVQLQKYYPQIFSKYDTETLKLQDIAKLKREIAEYDGKVKLNKAKDELGKAQEEVEKAKKALKDANGEVVGGMVSGTAHAYKLYKAVERLEYTQKQLALKRRAYGQLSDSQLFSDKGLSELTDKQLSAMLVNVQKAKRAVKNGKENRLEGSIVKGVYDEKGWENIAKQIKNEQEARKKPIKSYKEAVTDLKKEEEKANKELKSFNALTAQQLKQKKSDAAKNGNYHWSPDEERKRLKEEYDLKKKAREEYEKGAGESTKKGSHKRSTAESEAHTKARQAEERRQAEEQHARDLARSRRDAELNLEAERIALMKGGFAKEMAELQLQHKRKMASFDDQVQERLAKVREADRREWEATHNSKKEVYKQRKLTEADLSDTDLNQILAGRELADQALAQGQEKIIKELRDKYLSYEERKTEIKKRYDAERKIIDDTTLLLAEQKSSALIELAKKEKEELKAIDNERYEHSQRTNQLFVELFTQQGERTVSQMRSTIATARELMDYLANTPSGKLEGRFGMSADELASIQSSPEKLKAITDALRGLRDELGNVSPWQSFISTMEEALRRGKTALADYKKAKKEATSASTDEERTTAQKKADVAFGQAGLAVTKIGKSVQDATPLVQELGKSFGAIFGSSELTDAVDGMSNALSDLAGIASGIGSIMSGNILGGITSVVGVVAGIINRSQKVEREALEKRKKALEALTKVQEEYNAALLKTDLLYEKGTTVFGDDVYKRATNSIEVARKSIEQFRKAVSFTKEELDGNGAMDFLGVRFNGGNKLMRKSFDQMRQQIKSKLLPSLKEEFAKLNSISVKTGSHTEGWWLWKQTIDEYSTIGKLYPNLIDKSGKLNVALAESILKSHEFGEGGKAALENMLSLYKQNEEAIKSMNDYLHGLFGSLGSSITDALVTAFRTGEDATRAFTSNIGEMLNNFAKQMAYSSFLAPLMEKAQKDVADALRLTGGENQMEAMLRAMSSLVDGVKTQIPAFNDYLKKTEELVKSKGFDLSGRFTDTRSATAKGIAQASQDSIDVLSGLWHTSVLFSERTANATEHIALLMEGRSSQKLPTPNALGLDQFGTAVGRMYAELQAINRNTKATADATEASRFILSQMDSNGIKIKR